MKPTENAATESKMKDQIQALFEIMKSEKLEELEIKEENFSVQIKRKGKRQVMQMPMQMQPMAMPASEVAVEAAAAESAVNGETIQSPIMGMFYRAPSPSSPAFVKEGDVVDAGKTICIVEAMKVMNEIKAESRVKIVKILVENGKAITAGQDLFIIERP